MSTVLSCLLKKSGARALFLLRSQSSPGLLRCSSLDRNLLCGAPPLPQPPLLVPRQGAELLRLPCLHCSFLDRERSCSASPASVARSSARTRRALPPPASAAPSSTGSRVFPLPSIHCSLLGTNAPSSASPGLICSSLDKEMSSTSPGLICSSLNKESSSASPASSAACSYRRGGICRGFGGCFHAL